jgi:starch phosphorylase
VLTIVWARRFAEYKRPDLITRDLERFKKIVSNSEYPVQIIFAGKPYPMDYGATNVFNHLTLLSKVIKNMAVLTGYELKLSRQCKEGADVWLNNPRITREASGTSGMTAAMNGAINFSINDGWIPEMEGHGTSCFVLPVIDHNLPTYEQDAIDLANLLDMLENQIIPLYYKTPKKWTKMVFNSMDKVTPFFDSGRMVDEYYTKIYN